MTERQDEPREATKIVQFKLRISEELRAAIEAAAAESGGSMNSEIAKRLQESLHTDELFGGAETHKKLMWAARDILEVERLSGKSWLTDLATFKAASKVIWDSIQRARPKPPNYDEAQALLAEIGQELSWKEKTERLLAECGAMKIEQRNALAAYAEGGSTDPYYVPVLDEQSWLHPERPDEPATEEDKQWIRDRLSEISEIREKVEDWTQKMAELNAPVKEAERHGEMIYEDFKSGLEARIEAILVRTDALEV